MKKRKSDRNRTITMEHVLIEINKKFIKLKNADKKKNNMILKTVLTQFLKLMCSCNRLFECLRPRLAYLGSYFDGLRVGQPTEYDINIILTLHINYDNIKLSEITDGYTTIQLPREFRLLSRKNETARKGFRETELWCDRDHCLSVLKFRSWVQSVVDEALNTLPIVDGMYILKVHNTAYRIRSSSSGPASTLKIIESSNNMIDVDLVPTLAFKLPKIAKCSNVDVTKILNTNVKEYYVVPKPTVNCQNWRLAFPLQERFYLREKGNLKSTIKFLKLLRDAENFDKLASYYIKTLFLWEVEAQNAEFWENNSLTYLVLHMLKKLKESLLSNKISNYWCPKHNLLENVKKETCQIWFNRLSHIIKVMEDKHKCEPYAIIKYFVNDKL